MIGLIIMCQACLTMRSTTSETRDYFTDKKVAYQDKFMTVNNTPMHYIETGESNKPTLLFIHGSPGSWDAFKQYLSDSLLLRKYRMIAIDRPGFGYTNFGIAENLPTQSVSISEFVQSVKNGQPLVLIGHSLGGPLIAQLAVDNPQWYSHLVFLAASVDPAAENPEKWRVFIRRKPFRYLIPGALRPSNDELWWLKEDLVTLQPQLKKITANVTVIHGTKDQLVPYSNMAFLNSELLNATSINNISVQNGNHFIPWENYDLVKSVLLELRF